MDFACRQIVPPCTLILVSCNLTAIFSEVFYCDSLKSLIEMLYHKNPTQFEFYPQNFIRVLKLNIFCVFSPCGIFQKHF